MTDESKGGTVVELLLREPEIVAWLDDYRSSDDEDDGAGGDEPPQAA